MGWRKARGNEEREKRGDREKRESDKRELRRQFEEEEGLKEPLIFKKKMNQQ